MAVCHRFRAKPWYKPESKGLGAVLDHLAVMVGYYDFLPDRQFKSEGYRLEELVRFPHERVFPLDIWLTIMRLMQGPSHKENSTSYCLF